MVKVKRQNTHSSFCSSFFFSERKRERENGGFVTGFRALALLERRLASCLEEEQKNSAPS
jgi:hypothetical protein